MYVLSLRLVVALGSDIRVVQEEVWRLLVKVGKLGLKLLRIVDEDILAEIYGKHGVGWWPRSPGLHYVWPYRSLRRVLLLYGELDGTF